MGLPAGDIEYLEGRGFRYEVTEDGGMICVLVTGYALPRGYTAETIDLLLRLQPGYPDVAPDMWWCVASTSRRVVSQPRAGSCTLAGESGNVATLPFGEDACLRGLAHAMSIYC
jgi:hypothetical protein